MDAAVEAEGACGNEPRCEGACAEVRAGAKGEGVFGMAGAPSAASPVSEANAAGADAEDEVLAADASSAAGVNDEAEARARALAEHNALARVFEDVRAQSADSRLVEPSRWAEIGLVPAHLTPDEFEMFVYEYIEDDRAARVEAAASSEPDPSPVFRTATRAVGIPAFLRSDDEEPQEDTAEGAGAASAGQDAEPREACGDESAVQGDAEEATGETSTEGVGGCDSPGSDGPSGSDDGGVAVAGSSDVDGPDDPFAGLNIPAGYRLEEIEGEFVLVETGESEDAVELPIDCEHIVTLVGAHSYYVYDRSVMTDAYAHWAFLAAEDDRVVTFVDCVREDSRVYPRPLAASSLKNPPFRMTDEDIAATWEAVRASGEYPDIERAVASNGAEYFFSTDHLSPAYAASLAEWDAVERRLHM
ncbi:hypothetical protein B5F40_15660 [Gordonibacter sp. An230]|uniref:hypothetical protein n=1 Tax=Gordonibacter sp. An230 TaxID=1965592 RepID=UPI000B38B3AD|nr:hypothetical protein [Gordonibacter sp. An230]OUO85713.1 hypothetical protein B5F40_15660 [Gordonibacter sp. An230]